MKRILGFEQFVINENTKVNDVEYSYSTVNEAVITRNDIDKIRGLDLKTFLLKNIRIHVKNIRKLKREST